MKRYFIDSFVDDNEINEIAKNEDVQYEFMNYFRYINKKHDVHIVDIARVLSTTRQTIYNYLAKPTKDIPEKLKRNIASVYGVLTFEEVLDTEKKVEVAFFKDKGILDEMVKNNAYPDFYQADGFQETYEQVYYIEQFDEFYSRVALKNSYDVEQLWFDAIKLSSERNNERQIRSSQESNNEKINRLINELIEKSSIEYTEMLLRLINKNVNEIDLKLLNYIDDYFKNKSN